jgi:large subunit ribosomal protein L13
VLATHPTRVVERAVKGMLPKNTLGDHQLKKLKVYAGPEHPHQAQKVEVLALTAAD